jgi:Mg2+/citrate symporter
MKSFKIEKSEKNAKEQLVQVGVFMALIGFVGAIIVHPYLWFMVGLGIILAIGGKFADD